MNSEERELSSDPTFLESVNELAGAIRDLNLKAVREYDLVVDTILISRNRDIHHTEHTLDGLLDFCGYQPALLLYKKLCRYYFDIDPAATVSYINAYREIWESEPEAERR